MNDLSTITEGVNEADKKKFDALFGAKFANAEESVKVMAKFRKKAIPVEDIVNISGKLYYVDYPGYHPDKNPEPDAVYYEIFSIK